MHDNSYKRVEEVAAELRKCLAALVRRGSALPSDLVFETPETLHALRQLGVGNDAGDQLEMLVADAIGQVVEDLPASDAKVAQIMLGLDPTVRGMKLGERRERAAKILDIAAGTFRNRQEARVLNDIAQALAIALLSPARRAAETEKHGPDPSQVLLIHRQDSFGVKEVGRLVESLGLRPILWQQALDRAGLSSPSVIDRFRLCLETAQAVIVVFEGGPGEPRANLAFEAGLALGLAGSRTVIVQLGDQGPPQDLEAVNIHRLRNTEESLAALSAALREAGCAVWEEGGRHPDQIKTGLDVGWYRWTPERATNIVYADIAEGVRAFEPIDTEAGRAAASWLKEEALDQYPGVATYLQYANGRVEGFVALQAGSIQLKNGGRRAVGKRSKGDSRWLEGATCLRWIARHRDSMSSGDDLFEFAAALALEASKTIGSVALVLEPHDQSDAEFWRRKYSFLRQGSGDALRLWLPVIEPLSEIAGDRPSLASPKSAT